MTTVRYTPKEAAAKLNYNYGYFMSMVREGRFQHHKMSARRIYFTEDDLQAIEDASLVRATSPIPQ